MRALLLLATLLVLAPWHSAWADEVDPTRMSNAALQARYEVLIHELRCVQCENNSLAVALYRVERAAWCMARVYRCADARCDDGSALEGLYLAGINVMLQRGKVVIKIVHPVMRFGGVRAIAEKIHIRFGNVHHSVGNSCAPPCMSPPMWSSWA